MKMLVLGLALLSGAAAAQIPGAGVGVGTNIGAGITSQVPTAPVDSALGSANGTVRALDESARESARDAGDRATRSRVEARAGVRVTETTRCYDTTGDFDPWYRDGYYYCERSSPGVAAGAKVKTPG